MDDMAEDDSSNANDSFTRVAVAPLEDVVQLRPALDRLGNDWELLQDMARFFLEDAPVLVEKIREALARNDAEEAEWAGHSLKGLAAHFNANRLQSAAFEIEAAGRARNLSTLRNPLPELQRMVDAVGRTLQAQVLDASALPAET